MNTVTSRISSCVCLLLTTISIIIFPNFTVAAELNLLLTNKDDLKKNQPANDPFYSEQWYLDKIKINEAWKVTTGSSRVIVAVIDSGVDIYHPDLQENIWINEDEISGDNIDNDRNGYVDDVNGWDFIDNYFDPRPKVRAKENPTVEGFNHGTIVSGVIAAVGNNDIGISGISWHSKIMPLRVLNSEGRGDVTHIVEAINYAINNGADIINLSFAGNRNDPRLQEVVKQAIKRGLLVVTTAGNEGFKGLDSQFLAYDKKYLGGVKIAVGNVDADKKMEIITGPAENEKSLVNIFDTQGNIKSRFFAYNNNFRGGVNVATGDLDGDGVAEIITGAGFGGGPQVRIFNSQGKVLNQFFAYDKKLRNGVSVSAGDVNNDGVAEIVTGTGFGSNSEIKIFNSQGKVLGQFFVYDKKFTGGVNVATGDVNGDDIAEIITGTGTIDGSQVKIFNNQGKVLGQFFAYDKKLSSGVNVATGDVNGDGIAEIITGAGLNGSPEVKVFNNKGEVQNQFLAYDENFKGGINVASGKILSEDSGEIVTAINKNGLSYVRIKTLSKRQKGINLNKFSLYPACYQKDINYLFSVISTDVNDARSVFSNYGNDCVGFAAPGEFFFGLTVGMIDIERYGGYWSGTSLATPIISGTLALMKSIKKDLSPAEAFDILIQSSIKGKLKDNEVSHGVINAAKAIKLTKEKLINNK